jgi:hypothetical protein
MRMCNTRGREGFEGCKSGLLQVSEKTASVHVAVLLLACYMPTCKGGTTEQCLRIFSETTPLQHLHFEQVAIASCAAACAGGSCTAGHDSLRQAGGLAPVTQQVQGLARHMLGHT